MNIKTLFALAALLTAPAAAQTRVMPQPGPRVILPISLPGPRMPGHSLPGRPKIELPGPAPLPRLPKPMIKLPGSPRPALALPGKNQDALVLPGGNYVPVAFVAIEPAQQPEKAAKQLKALFDRIQKAQDAHIVTLPEDDLMREIGL